MFDIRNAEPTKKETMARRREYAYFSPLGPLRYLLRDKDGRERLGLYQFSQDGTMVLIGDCYGLKVVFWPTVDGIHDIIDERVDVSRVLRHARWTTTGLDGLGFWDRMKCRLWLMREVQGKIGKLPRLLPYLNLFYVFRQFRMVTERS